MSDRYALLDSSSLLRFLFYPRRLHSSPPGDAFDLPVPVEEDRLSIVCRAYPAGSEDPWILYFHGNGEIAADYDAIAPLYNERGVNLLVTDYRGYGTSDGTPTFQAMISDATAILAYVPDKLSNMGYRGRWLVMGRSIGSIPALELAAVNSDRLGGLIIESGFISVSKLINHLGLPSPGNLNELEEECRSLAVGITIDSLIIHGESDRLVPLSQGRELFETIGSTRKKLVTIPRADHNDIMFVDSKLYMDSIAKFVNPTAKQ